MSTAASNDRSNDNVNSAEIEKFCQLAESWWDSDGPLKTLHDLNKPRLTFIQQAITLKGQKIADIGCGGGILSESMAKNGASVTGLDMSQPAIDAAQKHASVQNLSIDYRVGTVEALALEAAQQYDHVTCLEMLEHVPDPAAIVKACHDLVKPGGSVFFSTINRHPKAYALAILGAEYLLGLLPRGTHDYQQFIRPSELQQWMREAGLSLINIKGFRYNPFSRNASLSDNVDVNYIVHAQRSATS